MGRPSKYPDEFKKQAVALVLDTERSLRAVADELGVNRETLRSWVSLERRRRAGGGALAGQDASEVARLRRRVAELEIEKEILKKAAAFFARETDR